jgi:L-2-hydroxyglutarate oxidase
LGKVEPWSGGIAALHVPTAAITDYRRVTSTLAHELRTRGVVVLTGHRIAGIDPLGSRLKVSTKQGDVLADLLIGCAGVLSDRVAMMAGATLQTRIVPFRGEYFHLRDRAARRVRGLIYPVPDPALPFLGVHATPKLDGSVEVGPNAVLALSREGYAWGDVQPFDLVDMASFPGFWRMGKRFWRTGVTEAVRSLSRKAFAHDAAKLLPGLAPTDLGARGAGVRAQAVSESGLLEDDFVFERSESALHVLNAPSPAATASFAIGRHVAGMT